MKIALIYDRVYPWLKGGGEKALWDIACELRALGHEVHYFGTKLWNGNDRIVRDGIVLHGVSRPAKFYNTDGRRSIFQPLIFSAGLFRALWRMRDADFNLINCTVFPFFSVFAVWLFRALSGRRIPWVLNWLEVWGAHYWREYFGSNVAGAIGYAIEWICARCCAEHLMISLLHARRMRTLLGVDPDRIHVIARGIDVEKISSLSKSIPKQKRVLYVGRLLPYKNVGTIVRAWPLIMQRFPEARLRIIGAGPSVEELTAMARASKIDIELLPPHENWDEIIREIAAAAVLVQPSIREGQSVVAIEAMAASTVVIAARHDESAVSDFIRHGDNGLLIDDWNNPQTWAAAITLLLDDADERARLAEAGARTAARFDWKTRLVPQLSMFFTQLASAGKCEREISDAPFAVRPDSR
jgi:glycosyltransferase involved in cell wall biosynthesis